MAEKRIRAQVFGTVQGVCFRHYTRLKAVELGLSGWVKNLADGSVETVISGRPEAVEEMVTWLHSGSPHAVVESVRTTDDVEELAVKSFDIRR